VPLVPPDIDVPPPDPPVELEVPDPEQPARIMAPTREKTGARHPGDRALPGSRVRIVFLTASGSMLVARKVRAASRRGDRDQLAGPGS